MIGSGNNASRGYPTLQSGANPLLRCLSLDQILLGNQKHSRAGEVRRVLGLSSESSSDDHAPCIGNYKPVTSEELKHFRESVQDASRRARDRVAFFRDSLFQLEKCKEALIMKKRQRCDVSFIERENNIKPGTHIQKNPLEITSPRLEESDKPVGQYKRGRTAITDIRAFAAPKQQIVVEKRGDAHKECASGSFRFEEKVRRLLGGGGGWDSKNKKKRSVGAVGSRSVADEHKLKRSLHPKSSSESKLRASDAQGMRSETSLETSISKNTSALRKNDSENASPSVGRVSLMVQKIDKKAGSRPKLLRDPTKAKASRATRTSSIMLLDSSLKVSLSSASLQGSDDSPSGNELPNSGKRNDQKWLISAGSASHGMTQWVGQRPHKNSRMRRSNIAAPVSNNDQTRLSVLNDSASELNTRCLTLGNKESPADSIGYSKVVKSVGSPFGVSESEESGAGVPKSYLQGQDNGETAPSLSQKLGSRPLLVRKIRTTPESNDGVRNGRTAMATVVRSSPNQISKSKTRRPPSKKPRDRKSSRTLNDSSLDLRGESDDDREELISAIKAAQNAKDRLCSGAFWKKVEPAFASVKDDDISFLKQQLRFAEELDGCLSHNNLSVGASEERKASVCESVDGERIGVGSSLYQRVLSAIVEDESEELYTHSEAKSMPPQYGSDDSNCCSCDLVDGDPKEKDRMEFEAESQINRQPRRALALDRISSNKSVSSNSVKDSSMSSSLCSNGYWLGDSDVSLSDLWPSSEICSNDESRARDKQYHLFSVDDRLLLELQSIGLCPEPLPDLSEGEVIDQEIIELRRGLSKQNGSKKRKLEKLSSVLLPSIDEEQRKIEQLAMEQLIEIAYRKGLACRGNSSKSSSRRVPNQSILAFIRRTLTRYRKFEEIGSSCFMVPGIQELLCASPADGVGSGTASNICHDRLNSRSGGAFSSPERYKMREAFMDDVIGSASSRVTSTSAKRSGDRRKANIRSVADVCSPRAGAGSKGEVKDLAASALGCAGRSLDGEEEDARAYESLGNIIKEGDECMDMFGLEASGQHDLDFFSNVDDDVNDAVGLEIPMDDLSDLHLVF